MATGVEVLLVPALSDASVTPPAPRRPQVFWYLHYGDSKAGNTIGRIGIGSEEPVA